ncbi:ABC transporter substrate-binding protein [Butyrivibrio sp. MC2013]|uniref:ABC transporter substrate-binding protein n=1 Tax=Butyrivibrio sp. MC2013 TaxID=1280686 RepID=UPI00041BE810|nr:ABC transporter substrate-binding protein [Butyrivibrio sp. MC2013]
MKRKLLSCVLAASMVMSMAACGSSGETSAPAEPEAAEEVQEETTEEAGETTEEVAEEAEEAQEETEVSASDLEPVTLKMYFHGSNVTDDSAVLEKVNEYLTEKLNCTLEPIWGTWGDFDTNAVLALQGGDDVDIYFTCSWSADEYNKFARDGYWVRLDDPDNNLIEQYGKDLWNLLPEVLTNGAKVSGADGVGTYAVPGYKDIATQNCWDVNVDRLTELGYTVDDVKAMDYYSMGDMLQAAKDKYGKDFYPLLVEGAVLERMVDNVTIVTGDSGTGNFMSYYINPDDVSAEGAYGNKIVNKFATDEFKKFAEKTREYYEAGYIDPAMGNAQQANDTRSQKQLSGEYLIGTQSYSLGYELQASQERGIEVAMVPCTDPYVDTTSSQGAMMAISTASQNPERAMMFLNLLNTDPYLMTLLNYGVEDVHYTKDADGLVTFTDKRAEYQPWTNGVGNVTILPPTADQGADFWDGFKAYYGAAKEIPILGYAYDSSEMETQMGAVANVVAEYMLPLCTGTVDPDEKLPEFLDKLEANGINDVLDDANAQLDAFMSAK